MSASGMDHAARKQVRLAVLTFFDRHVRCIGICGRREALEALSFEVAVRHGVVASANRMAGLLQLGSEIVRDLSGPRGTAPAFEPR